MAASGTLSCSRLAAQPLLMRQPSRSRAQAAGRTSLHVHSLARDTQLAVDGPGTGHRHFPQDLGQQYDWSRHGKGEAVLQFEMLSTEDCYRLFPLMTHISCPLRIEDPEPAGLTAQRIGDAGPATGRRRRPAPADSSTTAHSQLPYPSTHGADLRRELLIRHAPETVLQQRQQQRRMEA